MAEEITTKNFKVAYTIPKATNYTSLDINGVMCCRVVPVKYCPEEICSLHRVGEIQVGSITWNYKKSSSLRGFIFRPKGIDDYVVVKTRDNIYFPSNYASKGILDFDTNEVLGIPLDTIQRAPKWFVNSLDLWDYKNYNYWIVEFEDHFEVRTEVGVKNITPEMVDLVHKILPSYSFAELGTEFYSGPSIFRKDDLIIDFYLKSMIELKGGFDPIPTNGSRKVVFFRKDPITGIVEENPRIKEQEEGRKDRFFTTDQFKWSIPDPNTLFNMLQRWLNIATRDREFIDDFMLFLRHVIANPKRLKSRVEDLRTAWRWFNYDLYWDRLFERCRFDELLIDDSLERYVKEPFKKYIIENEGNVIDDGNCNLFPIHVDYISCMSKEFLFAEKARKKFVTNYNLKNIFSDEEDFTFRPTAEIFPCSSVYFEVIGEDGRRMNIYLSDVIDEETSIKNLLNKDFSVKQVFEYPVEHTDFVHKLDDPLEVKYRLEREIPFKKKGWDLPFTFVNEGRDLTSDEIEIIKNDLLGICPELKFENI